MANILKNLKLDSEGSEIVRNIQKIEERAEEKDHPMTID